jgi:SPP1 family predicted phage head-tail adaptor
VIAAGKLDQRITLQAPGTTEDALGQPIAGWTDVATVWAEAAPMRSRELTAGGAASSQIEVVFRLRYRTGLDASMRVLWRGVPYALVGDPVDVRGGRHTLELNCASGARAEA